MVRWRKTGEERRGEGVDSREGREIRDKKRGLGVRMESTRRKRVKVLWDIRGDGMGWQGRGGEEEVKWKTEGARISISYHSIADHIIAYHITSQHITALHIISYHIV